MRARVGARLRAIVARTARLLGAPPEIRDRFAPPDAIVVLGAPVRSDGGISAIAAERATAAARLWHAGGAPRVIATGAATRPGLPAEAHVIAEALRAAGVPTTAIVVDDISRTTWESARQCRALLAELTGHPAPTAWVVSQPFHGRRARLYFRRAQVVVSIWPIGDSVQYRHPRRALRWIVREYAALAKSLITWR